MNWEKYVDKDDPYKVIPAAGFFSICYTFNTTNKKPPDQLLFERYIILPIEHVANWRLIYQCKQTLIDKNTDRQNSTRTNHHLKVDNQVLIRNNQSNKYETPHKGPYNIIKTWINGKVTSRMGTKKERINIRRLKPYYN